MIDAGAQIAGPRAPGPGLGECLCGAWNGLPQAVSTVLIARVVGALLPVERARERDFWICRAARLLPPGLSSFTMAKLIRARLLVLAVTTSGPIDAGGCDGLLSIALLVAGRTVPSAKTIQRALER